MDKKNALETAVGGALFIKVLVFLLRSEQACSECQRLVDPVFFRGLSPEQLSFMQCTQLWGIGKVFGVGGFCLFPWQTVLLMASHSFEFSVV